LITLDQIKIAYKKLKASVYYDKTQLVLRNAIVDYEEKYKYDNDIIEKRFNEIIDILNCSDNTKWEEYISNILDSIRVLYFPKELHSVEDNVIINDSPKSVSVIQAKHFIDIDVEGQVLGILWVMTIGRILDKKMYLHSYGNRLRERIPKENNQATNRESYSPYLFEPYFAQYESWRDRALDIAIETLDNKQDTIILTMDFSRFYYDIHISKEESEEFYKSFIEEHGENESIKRLNTYIYRVLERYSMKMQSNRDNVFLPIGFYPSNILSNYSLKNFDDGVIARWNPLYYGRYVDDIIIVDKVENNSPLYLKAKEGELSNDFVINYFLCNCNADKAAPCFADQEKKCGLLIDNGIKGKDGKTIYKINTKLLGNKISDIKVKNEKVKVFYFKKSGSRSLLNSFKKALHENTSEFRYLPEDDAVLDSNDYSEIFELKSTDTINKLRGVDGISINKYAVSKFLGKLMRIGELIIDPAENQFEKDILKIFDTWNIIDNYTTWDKVIQILALNSRFLTMQKYIIGIVTAIVNTEDIKQTYTNNLQKSLLEHLHASLCRGLSLVWGKSVKNFINDLCTEISNTNKLEQDQYIELFNYKTVTNYRKGYCYSRMCDKYALISSIDFIIQSRKNSKQKYRNLDDKQNFNLTKINDFIKEVTQFTFDKSYCYYPYIITPQDLSFAMFLANIHSIDDDTGELDINSEKINDCIHKEYMRLNFNTEETSFEESCVFKLTPNKDNFNTYATRVTTDRKTNFNIAIANVELKNSDFISLLEGVSNRTYSRYRKLSCVFNEALREKADMLIFPESYLPVDWIPIVARTCAKNQLALVTGIEHFIYKGYVFNFTATILPYRKEDFRFAHITYHLKVHYSPEEERQIKGHRLTPVAGKTYDLFVWKDLWFPVYCCFELASISDRSMFKNYPDLFAAVEWNKDTNYFSNIIESLCRDMHCYCIQVNSSDYGDSRILQPSELSTRDIVKTKGGNNSTILVAKVDIQKLRSFQRKEYELQKDTKVFKPTPPRFDKSIIIDKINGKLWDKLIDKK
jgi:hypothetical protein